MKKKENNGLSFYNLTYSTISFLKKALPLSLDSK